MRKVAPGSTVTQVSVSLADTSTIPVMSVHEPGSLGRDRAVMQAASVFAWMILRIAWCASFPLGRWCGGPRAQQERQQVVSVADSDDASALHHFDLPRDAPVAKLGVDQPQNE
jgi:hypothetical protein